MTSQQYISKLQSLHIAMSLGALLLGIVCYFVLKPANGMTQGQSLFVMVGCSASIFFFLMFALLQKQKIEETRQQKVLKDKLISFQNSYMVILSMILGPALLNFMLYGLGGPTFNLILGGIFTALLCSRYISRDRLIEWLKLNKKEVEQFNQTQTSIFK